MKKCSILTGSSRQDLGIESCCHRGKTVVMVVVLLVPGPYVVGALGKWPQHLHLPFGNHLRPIEQDWSFPWQWLCPIFPVTPQGQHVRKLTRIPNDCSLHSLERTNKEHSKDENNVRSLYTPENDTNVGRSTHKGTLYTQLPSIDANRSICSPPKVLDGRTIISTKDGSFDATRSKSDLHDLARPPFPLQQQERWIS